jgi:hypothetical protein
MKRACRFGQRTVPPTFTVIATVMIAGLLSLPLHSQDSGLTDAEVDSAIAAAKQPRFESLFVEASGPRMADYSLIFQGPVGRTMDLAREAYDSYKPMTAAMVPASVRAHEVTLAILRKTGWDVPGIKNVVIMPPAATSRDAAIQPLPRSRRLSLRDEATVRDVVPRTWTPRLAAADSVRLSHFERFSIDALLPGDLVIILVTETGDKRYTVKAKDRERLR